MTTAQVCEYFGGLHSTTVNRWAQLGRLKPATKLPGVTGPYLFRRAEVERFAAERAAETASSVAADEA